MGPVYKAVYSCNVGKHYVIAETVTESCYLRSKTGWERVGLKVRKGEKPAAYYSKWNGMYYHNWSLYHHCQCEHIKGSKAKERREEFFRQEIDNAMDPEGLPF